ncbi:MAG TPA: DUF3619 family protein [Gallionella sp.]|nr:DUF3619 family protein [Gallionella sp.]
MSTNTNSPNNNSRDITPERIAQLLTRAVQLLDDNTVASLRRARNVALERQSLSRPVFVLSTGHGMRWLMPHSTHQWVATIILLAAILFGGVSYWKHAQENDLAHLDTAILIDDLPLEVFVD